MVREKGLRKMADSTHNMTVSFKSFIMGICDAVATASETLRNRNGQFLESYFNRQQEVKDVNDGHAQSYIPKSVLLEAPAVDDDGMTVKEKVEVPLLSLVPHSSERIEKMTLNIDLQVFIEDGELKVDLGESKKGKKESGHGTLEITVSPDAPSEGLQQLVSRYESIIRSQI